MSNDLPAGPYKTVELEDGTPVPYYIIEFDKNGKCLASKTQQHLLDHAKAHTDIYIFSHGWNNDWPTARERYDSFYTGFSDMRKKYNLPVPAGYRPLMVGIVWPGVVLVGDNDEVPDMAGGSSGPLVDGEAVSAIVEQVAVEELVELKALLKANDLNKEGALALARILRPLYLTDQDEVGTEAPSESELVEAWQAAGSRSEAIVTADEVGVADEDDAGEESESADVRAAGLTGKLVNFARDAVRVTTVWVMKDRAGAVGSAGVSPLLTGLLNTGQARVHLVGHSYGAKVVLSALCAPNALPRKVHSMLLLQPAVSHLCFAAKVTGLGRAGGYRAALERVECPILTTFSRHDTSLAKLFHLALRRDADLGDARIAGEPPSKFAALGGYGPRGAGEQIIDIQSPPNNYIFQSGVRIIGLRSDAAISGHGAISNPATWWALHNLVR